jgi:hypothetical protein
LHWMNRRRSDCKKWANLYEMRPIFFLGGGEPDRWANIAFGILELIDWRDGAPFADISDHRTVPLNDAVWTIAGRPRTQ